jgi:hypothetical protein
MQHSTAHTFKIQQSCSVKLYSSSYRDTAEIEIRDTDSSNKITLEGLTIAQLQEGVVEYVKSLGYRKEDEEAQKFLSKLSSELVKATHQEVTQ